MIHESDPQPGYYKTTLVRNGPWVPARIWLERGERDEETGELLSDEYMRCEIDGREVDAYQEWIFLAKHPITEAEYKLMSAQAGWDRKYDPEAPAAKPEKATDWNAMKPKF